MIGYKKGLTIAGSDSGGGAGIQADIKTMSAIGIYATSAITAVTAQNSCGVLAIQPIEPAVVRAQVEAVLDDIGTDAIKIGMLHSRPIVETIVDMLDRYNPRYAVLDPVMISTSGHKLITDDTIECIGEELFRRVTIVTPNLDEAELLIGTSIKSRDEMIQAGYQLMARGCNAVLMKGGHLGGDEMTDILLCKDCEPILFTELCIQSNNTHGTGCTLSSAIASYLAMGCDLVTAVQRAKQFITSAIKQGANVTTGEGHGPLNHFFAPQPLIGFEMENIENKTN